MDVSKPPPTTFDGTEAIETYVGRSTIGFVYSDIGKPLRPFGSGTLVRTGNVEGILTCGHVASIIEQEHRVGICLFPAASKALQVASVDVSTIQSGIVKFYDPPNVGDGPDLAFVPLPSDLFASLSARATALDLDRQERWFRENAPPGGGTVDVAAGCVGEMTPEPHSQGNRLVLPITGILNIGSLGIPSEHRGFDLLTFTPQPDDEFELPTSYKAISGGGFWTVHFHKNEAGHVVPSRRSLKGVIFFQNERRLVGHGPRSIFAFLLPVLRGRRV